MYGLVFLNEAVTANNTFMANWNGWHKYDKDIPNVNLYRVIMTFGSCSLCDKYQLNE